MTSTEFTLFSDHQTRLSDGTTYVPFALEQLIGLKCDRPGWPTAFIYLQADDSDHTDAVVLVRLGFTAEPPHDSCQQRYSIWEHAVKECESDLPDTARRLLTDRSTELPDGTACTPFIKDGLAGLKCERPHSRPSYLYFNPSDHLDGDVPNVFVYRGTAGDPTVDGPENHYVIWRENDTF